MTTDLKAARQRRAAAIEHAEELAQKGIGSPSGSCVEIADADLIDAQDTRIAKLEAALKPFAEDWAEFKTSRWNNFLVWMELRSVVDGTDFERAADVLAKDGE